MYWSIMLAWHCQSFQSISQAESMKGDWDYSELLKNLYAGILSEETLLGAEHLSQKALILYS